MRVRGISAGEHPAKPTHRAEVDAATDGNALDGDSKRSGAADERVGIFRAASLRKDHQREVVPGLEQSGTALQDHVLRSGEGPRRDRVHYTHCADSSSIRGWRF